MSEPWWKGAVIYQIYPRSVLEADPEGRSQRMAGADVPRWGVGDLEGVRRRLDHLVWLGVDALWLSPVFPSPMADFGYDVADYCDIDPLFGSLSTFDRLVADAHDRGLRVLLDWVPNHSSDRHPWFQASRSSRRDTRRDWYFWRHGAADGGPPNNWVSAFGGADSQPDGPLPSAWTYDEATGQWYLHLFLPQQPDLDWSNPEVAEAMKATLRFWLDRGVDGFRADVIHGIGKDPALPDDPPERAGVARSSTNDDPRTHQLLRELRRLVDGYPGDRVMVGEVFLLDTRQVATYYGRPEEPELQLAFNFPPLFAPWDAGHWRQRIDQVVAELDPVGAWPTWVLSNHDNPRHATRYGDRDDRARAAAVLLLGLRGTAFVYAGEELGLRDADVPADRRVDPGGRDGSRAPIPWAPGPGHGWTAGAEPWLPWPPDADRGNVEAQTSDPGSILWLYRRLLGARRSSPALSSGSFAWLDGVGHGAGADGVLAWERRADADRRIVAVSFVDEPVGVAVDGDWVVEVASDGVGEGRPYPGVVSPSQALVLRPA